MFNNTGHTARQRQGSSAGVVPSSATNRLGVLRQSLVDDAQQFHYLMEAKTVALREQMNSVRLQMVALDQHVSHEAAQRTKADEDIARSVDAKWAAVDKGFMAFVNQHCQRVERDATLVESRIQQSLDETIRARTAQDELLAVVRDNHRSAIAELHAALDALKISVIEFEGRFAGEMSKRCGQLEDRVTLNLSIQQRVSMDLVAEVRTALSKRTKEEDQHEANVGVLMLEVRQVQKQLADCAAKRADGFAAFTETMNSMVLEVNDAVKKMSLSRGSEYLLPKKK